MTLLADTTTATGGPVRWGVADSAELTATCLDRIATVDPQINAVLALDPSVPEQAAAADRRRADGASRGPLDGIPVLVKDNIEVAGLDCTAGSRLLAGAPATRDAGVVAGLRAAGAIPLGTANLSEWGNFRAANAPEGWSAVGGQTRNPHAVGRSPWGSSAGSAAAVAAGLVPLALGTETDGSIVCPAGANGVVGVKPERDLLPRDGVVPISPEQDTVGVFAARLGDAAACIAALTGRAAPPVSPLDPAGRVFGLWYAPGLPRDAVDAAAAALREDGAVLVEIDFPEHDDLLFEELLALQAAFPAALDGYLRTRPGAPHGLAALIAGNRADAEELRLYDQEVFEAAAALTEDDREMALYAGEHARDRARRVLDETLRRHNAVAVLAPTNPPAWPLEPGRPDPAVRTSSTLAALAGYPNISLPAAESAGLPLGVSVFGPARLDALLPPAAAVERACPGYRPPAPAVGAPWAEL